jgi:hypothetical protein
MWSDRGRLIKLWEHLILWQRTWLPLCLGWAFCLLDHHKAVRIQKQACVQLEGSQWVLPYWHFLVALGTAATLLLSCIPRPRALPLWMGKQTCKETPSGICCFCAKDSKNISMEASVPQVDSDHLKRTAPPVVLHQGGFIPGSVSFPHVGLCRWFLPSWTTILGWIRK